VYSHIQCSEEGYAENSPADKEITQYQAHTRAWMSFLCCLALNYLSLNPPTEALRISGILRPRPV